MNAPWKAGQAGNRDPFMAFLCDEITLDVARSVCNEMGWAQEKVNKGGLRNAIQSLSVSASPQILLVDLSESGDPINDINALAEVCEPGTVVIAMGQVNDVRLYRDLIISGLQDYLLKPINPDMLRDSIINAQTNLNNAKQEENGNERPHISTAVVGTRGGSGASTLATSLAWILSEKMQMSTGLLDLDVHFGTGALTLDLEPGRGLIDAIDNPSRIDGLFIERALIKANDNLSILSAEAPMNNSIMSDGSAFFQLQEEFRSAFDNSIIDAPRNMLIDYPHLANDLNVVVLNTELTLAAARDAIRIIAWLGSNAMQAKIIIVANKVNSSNNEISRKEFESSIDQTIDFIIPADYKACTQASKLGQTLIAAAPNSKASNVIVKIAESVIGSVDAQDDENKDSNDNKSMMKSLSGFKSILSKKEKE